MKPPSSKVDVLTATTEQVARAVSLQVMQHRQAGNTTIQITEEESAAAFLIAMSHGARRELEEMSSWPAADPVRDRRAQFQIFANQCTANARRGNALTYLRSMLEQSEEPLEFQGMRIEVAEPEACRST